jgi:hypothetical protein
MTRAGRYTVEIESEALNDQTHSLFPLWVMANDVISEIRQAEPTGK